MSYTALGRRLDMEKKSLQGNLSAVVRTVRKHCKRRGLPMTWVETLTSEPGLRSEFC
ncbi:hypothetical protein [Streptomyces sp. NPDC086787]|uniref:hypothetical protein n=1 Tax=Streptomyces sp. NPDC086787 TaxID=3365759 RepID=UPI0037F857B7